MASAAMLAFPSPTLGQSGGVSLEVPPTHVGIDGAVRAGAWTGMRLAVTELGSGPRAVRCVWLLDDADGDQVAATRDVTLTPQQATDVWLYAHLPYEMAGQTLGRVMVIDPDSQRVLAEQPVTASRWIDRDVGAMASTSNFPLNLRSWENPEIQQEAMTVLFGVDPAAMPDRWMGLSLLHTLVWTPDGRQPDDPAVTSAIMEAVGEWVRRGGHLIIMLPAIGETWTASPMADLLPAVELERVSDALPPARLGPVFADEMERLDVQVMRPTVGANVTTVIRQRLSGAEGDAIVTAKRHGAGRVTLVGVDLTDPRIRRMRLPSTPDFWRDLTGWRSPAFTTQQLDDRRQRNEVAPMTTRKEQRLGGFIRGVIAMRGSFASALSLAVVAFFVYWLAAPTAYALLRSRGMTQHAWSVFALSVALFTAACWLGALALRPTDRHIAQFSTVTSFAGSQEAHVHAWMSVFVPDHGDVLMELDPQAPEGNRNVLSSPGLPGASGASFLDVQRYPADVARPWSVRFPMRATARQIELDWYGRLGDEEDALTGRWIFPQDPIRLNEGLPEGVLIHNLPGELRNVAIIYAPGGGEPALVTEASEWAPGARLELVADPSRYVPLAREENPPSDRPETRQWTGFLPIRMQSRDWFSASETFGAPSDAQIVGPATLLSFHGALPPPRWWDTRFDQPPIHHKRVIGREMDISPLLGLRGVIVTGFLRDAPLPAPLTVGGRRLPARGWTMVRWISPITE